MTEILSVSPSTIDEPTCALRWVPRPPSATETQAEKEARWKREDEIAVAGGKTGNPFATLCDNCYGRHRAPRDKECPYPTLIRDQQ